MVSSPFIYCQYSIPLDPCQEHNKEDLGQFQSTACKFVCFCCIIRTMKLEKEQKEALVYWLSEDFQFVEINKRAGSFDPPFTVSEGQIKYYRRSNKEAILDLQETNGKDLTPRQLLFCEYTLQMFNGTQSSKLAGYEGDNDNIHAVNAHRLLRMDKIRKYLSKRYDDVSMKSDEVMARIATVARASLSDFMKEHGVIDWDKVKDEGYAISKITHTKGQKSRIEIEGRLRALELIGKYHGVFVEKVALTDPTGTKEYGADARHTILGKLLPELSRESKKGTSGKAD